MARCFVVELQPLLNSFLAIGYTLACIMFNDKQRIARNTLRTAAGRVTGWVGGIILWLLGILARPNPWVDRKMVLACFLNSHFSGQPHQRGSCCWAQAPSNRKCCNARRTCSTVCTSSLKPFYHFATLKQLYHARRNVSDGRRFPAPLQTAQCISDDKIDAMQCETIPTDCAG